MVPPVPPWGGTAIVSAWRSRTTAAAPTLRLCNATGHSSSTLWSRPAACAFIAIQAWTYGSLVADPAHRIPVDDFEALGAQPTFLLQLLYLPMGVVSLVGFGTLAILGWRRRAMPRTACAILAVAGLASLLGPFPPAGLLAGAALAWTARSAR